MKSFNGEKLTEPITIKEYQKKYYEQNKDKIFLNPVKCSFCGKVITKANLHAHTKSKKCISKKNTENKNNLEIILNSQKDKDKKEVEEVKEVKE
jgi:5-methylcytosine-specific restriction endonuclease McrA